MDIVGRSYMLIASASYRVNSFRGDILVKIENFDLLNISRLGELLTHLAHTVSRQDNKNK